MGDCTIISKKISVVIVAGGSGTRMGSEIPKQFLPLKGLPVLMHTLIRFHSVLPHAELILVMSKTEFPRWESLCKEYSFSVAHKLTEGGSTRFYSVKNGVKAVADDSEITMIHDGVRPFVSEKVIKNTLNALQNTGAVIPVVDAVDSMRKVSRNGDSEVVDRADFKLIQTPQVFLSDILKESYNVDYKDCFTDDATVVEGKGYKIALCEGDRDNIKITSPVDMMLGEILLNDKTY